MTDYRSISKTSTTRRLNECLLCMLVVILTFGDLEVFTARFLAERDIATANHIRPSVRLCR